jgi:CheY-like chemotaxis protein
MGSILIAEDDPISRRMLSLILRRSGYEVIVASNGSVALDLLQNNPVDIVILDLAMPVMDGLTLLRRIRADKNLLHLPVFILTASGDDFERVTVEDEGVAGFLTKPFSSQEIIKMIGEIQGGGPAHGET